MKNLIIVCILISQVYSVGFAQVITVSNQSNSPGQYSNLQAAINAANPGDTLYVQGSTNSYGNITVNKRLTFIGPGFNPQGQFIVTANIGSITLDSVVPTSSGTGSNFIGLNIANITETVYYSQINNILVDRCRISGSLKSYISGNNWIIRNCLFIWAGHLNVINIGNWSNLVILNNVFSFSPFGPNSTFPAIENSYQSSIIINNNIFTGYNQGGAFQNIANAQFSNNIFYGKSPTGATSSVFSNNLSFGGSAPILPPTGNIGQNNLVNVDPQFVSIPVNTFTFDYAYDFHLDTTLLGSDGTDIGIFGGTYPMPSFGGYIITGHPRLPQVYFLHLQNNVISLNTPLNITVKARIFDSPPIYTGEYFYDNDPGVGNGTPLAQFTPTNDTTIVLPLQTTVLQPGHHWIYFRYKDTLGKWGLHARMDFFSCNNIPLADFSTVPVCAGTPTTFTDLSTNTNANTVYKWDFTNDGTFDSNNTGNTNFTYPAAGTYTAKLLLTDTTGCNSEITHTVVVNDVPAAAGPITGPDTVCAGQTGVIYSVPVITGATSYIWNVPIGVTISGGGIDSIIVDFSSSVSSGNISLYGHNSCGYGAFSALGVFINQQPIFPLIGTITQPTCSLATGSVDLNGLPSGYWTINPGNISGIGSDTTISGLVSGNYYFTVTNATGCTSLASANVVINTPPSSPPTPTISLIGNTLHSDAPTGNQWYNQNGAINGATGQNYTVIADGYYYDIVTLSGCSSDTSITMHVVISGEELIENNNIKIYLNPSQDIVSVTSSKYYDKCTVTVFDALGKKVKQTGFFNNQLIQVPVNELAGGLYVVEVKMDENKSISQKIIKNN